MAWNADGRQQKAAGCPSGDGIIAARMAEKVMVFEHLRNEDGFNSYSYQTYDTRRITDGLGEEWFRDFEH